MRLLLVVAILAATATPLVAGNSAATPTVAHLSALSGQQFDVAFLQALIPVDEEAVEMAMTATLYADHPDLLHWNQDFVERQNGQVRQMLTWLQTMGANPAERRVGVMTASIKKLRALRGAALERAYLPMLASQLDQGTALARLAAERAGHPEVRDFAKQALKEGTGSSATLRGWLKTWY